MDASVEELLAIAHPPPLTAATIRHCWQQLGSADGLAVLPVILPNYQLKRAKGEETVARLRRRLAREQRAYFEARATVGWITPGSIRTGERERWFFVEASADDAIALGRAIGWSRTVWTKRRCMFVLQGPEDCHWDWRHCPPAVLLDALRKTRREKLTGFALRLLPEGMFAEARWARTLVQYLEQYYGPHIVEGALRRLRYGLRPVAVRRWAYLRAASEGKEWACRE